MDVKHTFVNGVTVEMTNKGSSPIEVQYIKLLGASGIYLRFAKSNRFIHVTVIACTDFPFSIDFFVRDRDGELLLTPIDLTLRVGEKKKFSITLETTVQVSFSLFTISRLTEDRFWIRSPSNLCPLYFRKVTPSVYTKSNQLLFPSIYNK